MRLVLFLILAASLVGVLSIPNAFAQDEIPSWVKNNAGWWATDQIDDTSFLQGIQYLIKEGIMIIPPTETADPTGSQEVPSWIKNNAGWWADGQIDDSSFVLGIQWLISNGIIIVEEKLIPTDPDLRVAFIGDQGLGLNAIAVLNLIKDEGAQMVLHQGDFDYEDDPEAWDKQITNVLGSDFPYFASIGGHDSPKWDEYQQKLYDRLKKNPDAKCIGDFGVKSFCTYKGLFFVLASPAMDLIRETGFNSFIENQLNNNDHLWRVCSWHHEMISVQNQPEPNETGLEIYESCKDGGAIIANGHWHYYARSQTLINFENQIVDPEWLEPNKLRVKEGATFTFISGLGGINIEPQKACLPSPAKGCHVEWPKFYTTDQGATFGALFCTFNSGGEPNKAYCYFKNIDGRIIDEFTVTNFLGTYSQNNNLIDVDMSGRNLTGDDFSNKVITDTNLSNAILVGADLTNAVLIGTTLTGADLTDASLTGVSLAYKDLTGTILRGADLTDASLTGVDLSGKDLTGTVLRGADLTDANLAGFDFSGRDLTGTILRGIDLTGKDITGTILRGADLTDSNLSGQDLSDHDLTDVILRKANLTNANITGLDLSVMDLTFANLSGQDLSDHDLTNVKLTGADLSNSALPDNGLSEKNFASTIFNGVDLSGKDLSMSKFAFASFKNTNLKNTNLSQANFLDADFTMLNSLSGADLSGSTFAHSDLSGVNLSDVILLQTNFYQADLSGVDFTVISKASAQGTVFIHTNLSNSNFEGVTLSPEEVFTITLREKAHLLTLPDRDLLAELGEYENKHVVSKEVSGNDLFVTFIIFNNFTAANLENANFKNAGLWFTSFILANLTNADLSGADLRNAFLQNANLSGANLEGAILDEAYLNCINHPICKGG